MRIMTIPCDGIGPEILAATLKVMTVVNQRFGLGMTFHEEEAGFSSLKNHGTTLREEVLDKARSEFDGVILGTQSHICLLYTSPSPRDATLSRMPSSA